MPASSIALSHQKRKKHTHPKRSKKIWDFDHFMFFMAIVIPFTTFSQILDIWLKKSAESVSMVTWAAYVFSSICWLIYALVHKEKILMINSSLWVIVNSMVVMGILMYQ